MERLHIPGSYQKSTRQPENTTIYEEGPWDRLPYRPKPNCRVCKGSGFLYPGHDGMVDYGNVVACTGPGCLRDSIIKSQPGDVARHTFENFVPVPGTEKALNAAKQLASGRAKFVWLLIYGPTGSGKTHLCDAIVKEVRDRGIDVKMVLAADMFALLKEGMETHQTDALLRRFKQVEFLAIDDYGVEYGSKWESAAFDELMTSRYANNKPTVLITNRELTELPERILSRFNDVMMARAIHNSAPDYRGTKR